MVDPRPHPNPQALTFQCHPSSYTTSISSSAFTLSSTTDGPADFISQYVDKPSRVADLRRKRPKVTKPNRKPEETVQFRPSVQGESVETLADITDVTDLGTLATTSHLFSDITSVDSNSDKIGPVSSMSALDREINAHRHRVQPISLDTLLKQPDFSWKVGDDARVGVDGCG